MMPRMQREYSKRLCVRRCGSFRLNPRSNRICNLFIVRGSALSAPELRSSIICAGFSASMASSYPKAHGVFWHRPQDAIAAAELSDLTRELFADLL